MVLHKNVGEAGALSTEMVDAAFGVLPLVCRSTIKAQTGRFPGFLALPLRHIRCLCDAASRSFIYLRYLP